MAAIVLLAFVYFTGRRMPSSANVWWAFLGMELINNAVPFSLIVFGEKRISSGLASIYNATTPLFTIVMASIFTGERLTPQKLTGVALGIGGVSALIGPSVVSGLNFSSAAQLACLAAASVYGCAGIFGIRFGTMGIDPLIVAAGQICGSTAFSFHLRRSSSTRGHSMYPRLVPSEHGLRRQSSAPRLRTSCTFGSSPSPDPLIQP